MRWRNGGKTGKNSPLFDGQCSPGAGMKAPPTKRHLCRNINACPRMRIPGDRRSTGVNAGSGL